MGLAAHVVARAPSDNRWRSVLLKDSLPLLETEIRSLLDRPAAADGISRDVVEQTLTDGYAHALRLDGERLRVESRLRDLVRSTDPEPTGIDALVGELASVDLELARLRALLSTLRAHAF